MSFLQGAWFTVIYYFSGRTPWRRRLKKGTGHLLTAYCVPETLRGHRQNQPYWIDAGMISLTDRETEAQRPPAALETGTAIPSSWERLRPRVGTRSLCQGPGSRIRPRTWGRPADRRPLAPPGHPCAPDPRPGREAAQTPPLAPAPVPARPVPTAPLAPLLRPAPSSRHRPPSRRSRGPMVTASRPRRPISVHVQPREAGPKATGRPGRTGRPAALQRLAPPLPRSSSAPCPSPTTSLGPSLIRQGAREGLLAPPAGDQCLLIKPLQNLRVRHLP